MVVVVLIGRGDLNLSCARYSRAPVVNLVAGQTERHALPSFVGNPLNCGGEKIALTRMCSGIVRNGKALRFND